MPNNGDIGTAADGTAVVWSAAANKAFPLDVAKKLGITPNSAPGGGGAAPATVKSGPDAAALKALGAKVQQANDLADRANEFMRVQGSGDSGVATGPAMSLPIIGPAVRAIQNWTDPDTAAKVQQLEGISGRTWPMLRPAGQGPLRGGEVGGFKQAFPSVGSFAGTNEAERQGYVQDAAENRAHLKFVSDFVNGQHGSFGDAETAYALAKNGQAPAGPPAAPGPPQAAPAPAPAPTARAAPQAAPAAPQAAPRQQPKPLSAPDNYSPGWSSTLPPKQLQAAKLFAGSKAAPGTQGNPLIPRNKGQFDKLASGSWVLDDDGTVFQKR